MRFIKDLAAKLAKPVTTGLAITGGAIVSQAHAAAVTIPDTGIDVPGYVTAGITAIGAVVAVCVGGYFAFLVIKRAIKWAGHALG